MSSPSSSSPLPSPPSIPLDWTRVRKREACCAVDDDGTGTAACRHRRRRRRRRHPNATASLQRKAPSDDDDNNNDGDNAMIQGTAVICLLDCTDPQWFQAYLFWDDDDMQRQCWGLLGVQKEIDECLQCSDGGYRVIDLKVNGKKREVSSATQQRSSSAPSSSSSTVTTAQSSTDFNYPSSSPSTVMFRDVEWTGGNMMQLSHPRLTLQANTLLSGVAAVPIAERVFAGLLRRVRGIGNDATNDDDDSDDDDDDESENATTTAMTTTTMMIEEHKENEKQDDHVLDMFPDLAIVVGQMELRLPLDTTT